MSVRTTRHNKKAKIEKLLDSFRAGFAIRTSCAAAGISSSTYYLWRQNDPGFALDADEAMEYGTDVLEDVAISRAVGGSDTLLIFMLKARRKQKYGEMRVHVHQGDGKQPIRHEHDHRTFDMSGMSSDEQDQLYSLLEKVRSGLVEAG